MRPLGFLTLFIPLVVACGVGTSQSHEGSPPADAGEDAGCGPVPLIECLGICGEPVGLECVNGAWTCPVAPSGGETCPIDDAGIDAGCQSPVPTCDTNCPGPTTYATCEGGEWVCPSIMCAPDASPPPLDASPPPVDASPPPLFACGDNACDPETTYCLITAGGPVLDDGGTGSAYSCDPLPPSCVAGAATCECIAAMEGSNCGCVANDGKVIETCAVP